MNAEGQKLPQSDFIASQTVLRQMARDEKPIYMAGGIAGQCYNGRHWSIGVYIDGALAAEVRVASTPTSDIRT